MPYHISLDKFFDALRMTETGYGKEFYQAVLTTVGDGGKSYGPLQITTDCWNDALEWMSRTIDITVLKETLPYSSVADYRIAKTIAFAYFNRYEKKALFQNNWEVLAKCWNGGPDWRDDEKNKPEVAVRLKAYWLKVRKNLKIIGAEDIRERKGTKP